MIFQLFFQIQQYLKPYDEAVALLVSIPGVAAETAACILGEIGADMSYVPSAAHLASEPEYVQAIARVLECDMNLGLAGRRANCQNVHLEIRGFIRR